MSPELIPSASMLHGLNGTSCPIALCRHWLSALAALLFCGLLGACAAPQSSAVRDAPPAGMPYRLELAHVPFFPQEEYQCGPAALASVLLAAQVAVTPEGLRDQVYLPGREGALQAEMLATTRRHGLIAYSLEPHLEALLRAVAQGMPAVVLQNLSLPMWPRWHYAVVIGYDLEREEIVLRSGLVERLVLSLHVFEHTWARSGHWAMLALPPHVVPVGADANRWLNAAVALERADPEAARAAYGAASQRWPDALLAHLGSGNTAYAMGNLAAAELAYRSATETHPDAADAWNNLAQVVYEQGRRSEALQYISRAITLGGKHASEYEATRASMLAAQQPSIGGATASGTLPAPP